jgi:hypothetical protein
MSLLRGAIFQLVRIMNSHKINRTLKKVALLRLSPYLGAPLLDVASLYVPHRIELRPPAGQDENMRRVVE